jgi:hypothetical protein
MALFTVTTNAYVNQPPSQVGNGSASTEYGNTYTFTVADFTTLTSPVYADPEGDTAANLRVLSLPATGELQYNSVAVTINQVISFTDIGNNLFTYVPDNSTTSSYIDTFNFEIADSGSGQFVG